MANRIIGLKNIHLAPMTEEGVYQKPIKVEGAKSLKIKNNFTDAQFYSDDVMDYASNILSSLEIEMELAYLLPELEAKITGKTFNSDTGVMVSKASDRSNRFALLFEMTTLEKPIRKVIYDVTLNKDETNSQTQEDKVEEQLVKLTGVAKPGKDGAFDLVLDANQKITNGVGVMALSLEGAKGKERRSVTDMTETKNWQKFFEGVLLPDGTNFSPTVE